MQVAKQGKENAAWFVLVFFLSGAAGLAYQMVWAKAFVASIGSEYPAVLAVVTAFMAGMAFGNLLLAKRSNITPKLYGILELIIGVWGAATVLLIPFSESITLRLLGPNPASVFHWSVVFVVVTICLLPATTAMGATLAAAERFVTSRLQHHSTGLLYGANTAGSTLGAILAAFWLMPTLGIRASLFVFAGVNFVCGFAALRLVKGADAKVNSATSENALSFDLGTKLFLTGLLGIGLEVVVIRALSHVLENTVYTFAVVLAVYLAGNAAGALIVQKIAGRKLLRADWLFAALAIASVIVGMTLRWSGGIYLLLRNAMGDSLTAVASAEYLTAATFFFLPSLLMGAILTLLAQESLQSKRSLACAVGLNTAGAALGPIAFGLLAIPLGGLKGALAIFPISYALLAGRKMFILPIIIISAACVPFITSVQELIDRDGQHIVSIREGVMGSVAVLETENGARVLKFNNRFQMGGTAARAAEERQAIIPLLLHENPQNALFIGLGTGITFAAANHFTNLQADGVELVPEIAAAMPWFNESDALQSTNLKTHVADGRRFVRATAQKYDVIVSDLFHPAQDGAGFLYTREHFAAIRDRLIPRGLFCQWLPIYQMDVLTLHIVMRTFAEVFPTNEVWLLRFNVDVPVIGLIGRKEASSYSADFVEKKLQSNPDLAEILKRLSLADSVRLIGGYVGPIDVHRGTAINSDWNPIIIFHAPEITFRRRDDPGKRLLALVNQMQKSPQAILAEPDGEFSTRLDAFIRARNIYLTGLQLETEGDVAKAIAAYVESARMSADFTAGYAQAITLATALSRERPEQSREILQRLVEVRPDLPVAAALLRGLPEASN